MILAGKIAENVVFPRQYPASENDARTSLLECGNHLLQIGLRLTGKQTVCTVVASKFEDHDRGTCQQSPTHSSAPAVGGVAADPRVHDAVFIAVCVQPGLQLFGISERGRRHAEARRQAISKCEYYRPRVGLLACCKQNQDRDEQDGFHERYFTPHLALQEKDSSPEGRGWREAPGEG